MKPFFFVFKLSDVFIHVSLAYLSLFLRKVYAYSYTALQHASEDTYISLLEVYLKLLFTKDDCVQCSG